MLILSSEVNGNMNFKKSKVSKVLIIVFLALSVIMPVFASSVKYSNSYDFTISSYKLDAIIDEYGDMHVVESVTNNYHNINTVFYKNLVYGKNNGFSTIVDRSSLVKDVRVKVEDSSGVVFDTDVTSGDRGHYVGYSYNGDRDELGNRITCEGGVSNCAMIFYYDSTGISDVTTFTYEYTIQGVITEYGDISELNWIMLGEQPMNVENVEINITLPDGDYNLSDEYSFFHGTNSAYRNFIDNNKVRITSEKIVSGEKIEVRLLVGKDVFSNIRSENKTSVNRLSDILLLEESQAEFFDRIYKIGLYGSIGGFVLGVLLLGFFVYRCYKKHDKEFSSDFYNEYYRELPASYSPAVMGYLYKFREIDDNDLTATLLDLIRRKYLILENPSSTVNDDNPDYIIKLNKESSLGDLTKHEKHLIKWFIEDIGNGSEVHSQDLSDYCDEYNNAVKYQNNNTRWVNLVKEEAKKYDFFDKSVKNAKAKYSGLGVIGVLLIIGLLVLKAVSALDICGFLATSLVFIVLAYYVYVNSFDRRSKKGNEDFVRWRAFKKFLEEFSSFEDYPVPSLIIWEHYLVYATSFGIADKVTSQLKLKFKLNEINDLDTTFILYYGLRYNYMVGFHRSIYRSRAIAASTIARYNASKVGGGRSSGGGFSGGSSFGGGGGSFGGR